MSKFKSLIIQAIVASFYILMSHSLAFSNKSVDSTTNTKDVSIVPTAIEVNLQIEKAIKLDSTKKEIEQLESKLNNYSSSISILQSKVTELQDSISKKGSNKKIDDAIIIQTKEIERLKTEIETIKTKKQKDISTLKTQTITEWANSADVWYVGLQFGQTLYSIHANTVIFPENKNSVINSTFSIAGQIAALVGTGLLTYQSSNNEKINYSGPTFMGVGFSTYFITTIVKNFKKDDKKQNMIREYVERVAQHKIFNSELSALNDGVTSVRATMADYIDTVIKLRNTQKYSDFELNNEVISKYRNTVESYSTIISLLSRTNSLSSQLLKEEWNDTTKARLENIYDKTKDAIVNWRREIIIAERLLTNMEKVVEAEKKD